MLGHINIKQPEKLTVEAVYTKHNFGVHIKLESHIKISLNLSSFHIL
jgi:hypothetical protein